MLCYKKKKKWVSNSTETYYRVPLEMPGLEGWDVHLRQSIFSLKYICVCMYSRKILARGGMDTVLISAALAAGTVESLWKSPRQLQWLFAG